MSETEPTKRRGRPATGQTPKHYFRAPQALWDEVVAAAAVEPKGTATALVVRAIERELRRLRRERATPE